MIKAILVDDEERSVENLQKLLANYCSDIEIIFIAYSVEEAYTSIEKYKPDLVFLDIDMPPLTGFDLLKKYDTIPFEVIFVTAYDYYAIDAIKFSALDYILKPIKVSELKDGIARAKKKLDQSKSNSSEYFQLLDTKSNEIKRIVVKGHKGMDMLDLDQIIYIEADNVYSTFVLSDNRRIISSKSIKDYEEMLSNKGFFRIHKSHIVNISHVKHLDNSIHDEVKMSNGDKLILASRRKDAFVKLLA